MTKTLLRWLTLAAVLPAVAGCSWIDKKKEQPPCPRVSVLADSARMVRFKPGPGRDISDVELSANFSDFKGSCLYDWDKKVMSVNLQIVIDAQRGPAAQGRKSELSYFVAIPAFFPSDKAKVVMPVSLEFPDTTDRVRYGDKEVSLNIPIPRIKELAAYEVFIGLQLTEDQVEYNRNAKGRF